MELPSSEPTSPHAQRAVEELFDAVRAVDPILRDALIDSATVDPWVRAEVRSLLAFDVDATPTFDDASRPAVGFDPSALIGVQVDTLIVGEHACDCQPPPLLLPKSLSEGLHHE